MKVCYCDESGTGDEPIAVLVGVVVDSQRMHVTKEHWGDLLENLSTAIGKKLSELHTRNFYAGSGVWHGMDGNKRSEVISLVFDWIKERKHHFVYSSVVKERYYTNLAAGNIPAELNTLWRFLERKILPYGECFSVAQKIYDTNSYDPQFTSRTDYQNFLDDCIDLGSYSFDVQDDLLVKVSNHLVEISFSE